ncbi:MAG: hemerythrin domain-containing protein [Gemmatimonadota bacterium]
MIARFCALGPNPWVAKIRMDAEQTAAGRLASPQRLGKALDPLTRQPEAGVGGPGLSPMDPPDAYAPPGLDAVELAQLHPFLAQLCTEHALLLEGLGAVEETIRTVQDAGFTRQAERTLLGFVEDIDTVFIPHSRQEEVVLFPLLRERLIADGEHGKGRVPTTAVDLMADDHLTVIRLAAVIANFLKLGARLPDERSARIVQDAALRHAGSLVAVLRLHIFREDNIVFSSAHRLIAAGELDAMQGAARRHSMTAT